MTKQGLCRVLWIFCDCDNTVWVCIKQIDNGVQLVINLFVITVCGFQSDCISNCLVLLVVWTVNLITHNAWFTLSLSFNTSSRFTNIVKDIVWSDTLTNLLALCKYGNPTSTRIPLFMQKSSYSLFSDAKSTLLRNVFRTPCNLKWFHGIFITVFASIWCKVLHTAF